MRTPSALALGALLLPAAAWAQIPSRLEAVEVARSRTCVPVLERLETLDRLLAPMATRSQRLLAIAQGIALEDDAIVDQLDVSDSVEAAVRDWFTADAALAARNLREPSPTIQEERTAAREAIKVAVTEALEEVQAAADSTIRATGDLQQRAGRCTGAVLVRPVVLEACGSRQSAVCDAARDTAAVAGARFVDSAATLWDVQELRAWTAPGPLAVTPTGQLGGARTVGVTRMGNVTVSIAFTPWIQDRSELSPENAERARALTDSLGFGDSHPEVVFVPALAIRATLPEALDEEQSYLLHFGSPESADVVWQASADSGAALDGMVPLAPRHLARLRAGEPLLLTAIRQAEDGQLDALYVIELTNLNQGTTVNALLGYMAGQLSQDLARLIPPGNA